LEAVQSPRGCCTRTRTFSQFESHGTVVKWGNWYPTNVSSKEPSRPTSRIFAHLTLCRGLNA